MNIAGFTNNTGSAQWRLQGPANYINARTKNQYFVASSNYWNEEAWMPEIDLVVAQMWRNPKGVDFAHSKGVPVVFDADDIILGLGNDREELMDLNEKHKNPSPETYEKVDVITVTTEALAEHYRQYNDNVVVLPNYMDYMWWGEPLKIKNHGQLRIGWMGSKSHKADLEFIAPVMKRVMKEFDFVKFIFCGFGGKSGIYGKDIFKDIPPAKREYYPGVNLEYWPYKSKTLGLDIGIAPLVDDGFNAGKSAIKYYEYSANGVPGVYSDTIVYRDTVKHGVTGFLAKTPDDWYKYLEKLIVDTQVRKIIRRDAFQDVFDNYNLEDHYKKWVSLYERTCRDSKH